MRRDGRMPSRPGRRRAIAPPRTRIWVIAIGELGAAIARGSSSIAASSSVVEEQRRCAPGLRCSAPFMHLVDPRVRHRQDELGHRRGDLPERLERRRAVLGVAVVDEHDRQGRLEVDRLGNERRRRGGHDDGDDRQLLRGARRDRHERLQDLPGRRQEQRAAEDHPDRVEPELEAGHDAEVAAAAADRPEQVRMLVSLAVTTRPSAVTTSTDTRASIARPCLRTSQPMPPPRVRPDDADAARVAERRRETVGARPRSCIPRP